MSLNHNTTASSVNTDSASRIRIDQKTDFFAWLPNCIVYEWGLSSDAIAAALYLNGKPADWQCRPFDVKKHFKWGCKIWARVSRELKAAGLLHEKITSGGTELWFRLPEMKLTVTQKPTSQNGGSPKGDSAKRETLSNKDIPEKDLLHEKENILCSEFENENHGLQENKQDKSKPINKKDDKITENEIEELFDKLWGVYPVKKGKQEALKALLKIFKGKTRGKSRELAMEIIRGFKACLAEHSINTQLKEQGADIWCAPLPHLSTWINKKRWLDPESNLDDIIRKAKKKNNLADLGNFLSRE